MNKKLKELSVPFQDVVLAIIELIIVILNFLSIIIIFPYKLIEIIWKNSKIQLFFIVKSVETRDNLISTKKNLEKLDIKQTNYKNAQWTIKLIDRRLERMDKNE